ncbi:MAG: AAA family ATPase [Lachnospiraceae bacterium]|nr:AAA family ATPase [Lachnospiraceae bacterium]
MKIKKVIFENINSYEGEVTIDFTDPEFAKGNNQFVICGPMGSGKSTILDAITLALYGSTARLGRFTTSSGDKSNELINKHSGYCRAEVIYSCKLKEYTSVFELHKARDRVDGKVQTPQCAVYEMDGDERVGNLLDSTTTDALKKKTESLIGLNYDQFIQCILIPQGRFEDFLRSDEREKAGILAKLSHTEHYKEAARLLNEKASELNMQYNGLKKERDAISVMTEEERENCGKQIEELQKQIREIDENKEVLQKKIDQINQLNKAESEFKDAEKNLNEINAESETYKVKEEELAKARKAEDCAVEYRSLQDCIAELKTVQDEQIKAEAELATYASEKAEAEEEKSRCTEAYEKKREERDKQKDIWTEVRKKDTEISVTKNDTISKKEVFDNSNKNYEDRKTEYDRLKAGIGVTESRIKELSSYIDQNKADEGLEVTLATYTEKRKAWNESDTRRKQAENELKEGSEKQKQLQKIIDDLNKEKDEIAEQLHNLVSSKYLLVAGILRQDLKAGMSCPVCGKKYVSADADSEEIHVHSRTETEGEQNQVAQDISDLNDALEEKGNAINEATKELQIVENKIKTATDSVEQEKAVKAGLMDEFNKMLLPWNATVNEQTSEEEFDKIKDELCKLKDDYKNNKTELDRLNSEYETDKKMMGSIDLNKLLEERNAAEEKYKNADQKCRELEKERQELFGSQSVDEVERAFDEDLKKKEEEKGAAEKKLQKIAEQHNTTKTQIGEYKKRNDELNVKQGELNSSFLEKLKKNLFASEEEYLNSQRTKQQIDDLDKAIGEYEKEKTAAETTYKNTKTTLDKLREKEPASESLETLTTEKEGLEESKNTCNQNLGGLDEKLKQDDKNKKAWEDADTKLKELGAEAEIYSRINEMLGKKDGSDFEVFVQGIAMRSLLEKANVYLMSIIPQYRLEQKSEYSIDFIVVETMGDLTEVRRDVTNFSGGEKFIISLSLALAMAEFAGQNGDVECIFLDEGFGTLSGNPLSDAINALKRLSSTGKMLGIITHIDAVINEFNKIEAKKTGEKSTLSGPGVVYMDRRKKAK